MIYIKINLISSADELLSRDIDKSSYIFFPEGITTYVGDYSNNN